MVCLPLRGRWVGVPGRIWLFLCFYNMKQNRKQLFDPFWAPRVRLFYDNYMVVVVKKLIFGHFGLEIGPLWPGNRNKNPWDYKTRAQELTSGAIRMFLSSFVEIWEHFKDEGHGVKIAASISVAILTFFTDFNIFWLWIDQFAWNWWPN